MQPELPEHLPTPACGFDDSIGFRAGALSYSPPDSTFVAPASYTLLTLHRCVTDPG